VDGARQLQPCSTPGSISTTYLETYLVPGSLRPTVESGAPVAVLRSPARTSRRRRSTSRIARSFLPDSVPGLVKAVSRQFQLGPRSISPSRTIALSPARRRPTGLGHPRARIHDQRRYYRTSPTNRCLGILPSTCSARRHLATLSNPEMTARGHDTSITNATPSRRSWQASCGPSARPHLLTAVRLEASSSSADMDVGFAKRARDLHLRPQQGFRITGRGRLPGHSVPELRAASV